MGDYFRDPGVDRLCRRRGGGDISVAQTRSPRMDGRLQGSHTVLCGRGPTTAYNTDCGRGQEMGSHSEFISP